MKKYSIPEMNISVFECENVVTQSGPVTSAFDEAKAEIEKRTDLNHTFTVVF